MADLASLQLKIESSDADIASKRLSGLAESSERLRKAVNNMEQRWDQATRGMKKALKELDESGAFKRLTDGFFRVANQAGRTKESIVTLKTNFTDLVVPINYATDALKEFQANLSLGPANRTFLNLAKNVERAATAAKVLDASTTKLGTTTGGTFSTKLARIESPQLQVANITANGLTVTGKISTAPGGINTPGPGGGGGGGGGGRGGGGVNIPGGNVPGGGGGPAGFFNSFTAAATPANAILTLFNNQLNALNKSVSLFRISGSFLAAGFIATRVANSALVQTLKEYETKLITLRQVGVDNTASIAEQNRQFALLNDTARKTGRETAFSALETATALEQLTKAGFDATQGVASVGNVLKFAESQVIDVGTATTITTSALRQFGIDAGDTGRVVDSLATVANKTSTDVLSLGEGLKFVGPIAAQLNKTIEETSAALGVLGNAGIQGALAGTNLRGVFTALTGPTDIARKTLKNMGLEIRDLDPTTNSLQEIIKKLADANITTSEAVDIFNRKNAASALILVKNFDALKKLTEETENSRLSVARFAAAQENSLAGSLKKLKNAYDELILSNQGLGGALKSVVDTLAGGLKAFSATDEQLQNLTSTSIALAKSVEYVTYALLGFGAIGVFAKIYAGASTAYTAIKAAQGALATFNAVAIAASKVNPFLTIISLAATAYGAFKLLSNESDKYKDNLIEIANSPANKILGVASQDVTNLGKALQEAGKNNDIKKQFDLLASLQGIVKSLKIEIDLAIQNNDTQQVLILRNKLNDVFKAASSAVEGLEVPIEVSPTLRSEKLAARITTFAGSIADLLRSSTEDKLTTVNILQGLSIKNLKEDLDDPSKGVVETLKEMSEAFTLSGDIITEEIAKISSGLIGLSDVDISKLSRDLQIFLDSAGGKGKTKSEILDFLVERLTELSKTTVIPVPELKGDVLGQFDSLGDQLEEGRKKLQGKLGKLEVELDAEDFADKKEEFVKVIESATESYEEFRKSVSKKIDVDFSLLSTEDAAAQEAFAEALERVNSKLEAQAGLYNFQIEQSEKTIRNLQLRASWGEDVADSLEKEKSVLATLKSELAGVQTSRDEEVKAVAALVNLLEVLTRKRAEEAEILEARKTAEGVLRGELSGLLTGNRELQTRLDILEAEDEATKKSIRSKAFFAEIEAKLNQEQSIKKLTIKEVIQQLVEQAATENQLTAAIERRTLADQNSVRQAKQKYDAIKRLNQDLTAELNARGRTKVEGEVFDRIKRVTSVLVDENGDELVSETASIADRLRGPVEDILNALDQEDRARQVGRDVAAAFSKPLQSLFSGGSLKDAANDLLKGLFNIFLNVNIFKPIEEFFEKAFTRSDTLTQAANPGKKLITEEQVEEAKLLLNQLEAEVKVGINKNQIDDATRSIKSEVEGLFDAFLNLDEVGAKGLDSAFDKASSAAKEWQTVVDNLTAAFNEAARIKDNFAAVPGGIKTDNPPIEIITPESKSPVPPSTEQMTASENAIVAELERIDAFWKAGNQTTLPLIDQDFSKLSKEYSVSDAESRRLDEEDRARRIKDDTTLDLIDRDFSKMLPSDSKTDIEVEKFLDNFSDRAKVYELSDLGASSRQTYDFLKGALPDLETTLKEQAKLPKTDTKVASELKILRIQTEKESTTLPLQDQDFTKLSRVEKLTDKEVVRELEAIRTATEENSTTLPLRDQDFSKLSRVDKLTDKEVERELKEIRTRTELESTTLPLRDQDFSKLSRVDSLTDREVERELQAIRKASEKSSTTLPLIERDFSKIEPSDRLNDTQVVRELRKQDPVLVRTLKDLDKSDREIFDVLAKTEKKNTTDTKKTLPPSIAAQGITERQIRSALGTGGPIPASTTLGSRLPLGAPKVELSERTLRNFESSVKDSIATPRIEDRQPASVAGQLDLPRFSGDPIESGAKDVLRPQKEGISSLDSATELSGSATALSGAAAALEKAALLLQQLLSGAGSVSTPSNAPSVTQPRESGGSLPPLPPSEPFAPSQSTFNSTSSADGSGTTFGNEIAKGLTGQGFGFINNIFARKFGFALPSPFGFSKGGVISNSRIIDRFEKGGTFESSKLVERFAEGGTFNNRTIEKVADFRNKVVSKSTITKLAEFGEKGPEAIMPLKNKDGRLGVSAFLGGKEITTLKLTRGEGGKLGVDFSEMANTKSITNNLERSITENNNVNQFAKGGVFTNFSTNSFSTGSIFNSGENKPLMAPSTSPVPEINVNVKSPETKESQPMNITIRPTYVFGNNVRPDEAFKRSARQHEDDLKDRTRRALS